METIAILLATYNGDSYLCQQIDSIISQTNEAWVLYIRDDGSTDSTLQIIHEYRQKDSRIILLNDHQKHRGAKNSFVWLMENVNSDYYMFCDQDDVWLSNKIEICLRELKNNEDENDNIPLLVFTDLFVVDDKLNIISSSMWEYTRLKLVMSPRYLVISPYTTGCTMFFNHLAKVNSLKYTKMALMHDSLLALSTSFAGGKVPSIPISLIYYRQHENNTLGVLKFNNRFVSRFIDFKNVLKRDIEYYKFSNSITGVSIIKFILLKMEAMLKVRTKTRKAC